MSEMSQQRLNSLESWRSKASAYAKSDRIGRAICKSFDLIAAIVEDGVYSERVNELSELLERDRAFEMEKDSRDPSSLLLVPRDLVYGMIESLCSMVDDISEKKAVEREQAMQILPEDANEHMYLIQPNSFLIPDFGLVKDEATVEGQLNRAGRSGDSNAMNDTEEDEANEPLEDEEKAGTSQQTPRKRRRVTNTQQTHSEKDDEDANGVEADTHCCRACDNTFSSKKGLLNHVTQVHKKGSVVGKGADSASNTTPQREFACTRCSYSFAGAAALATHMNTHTGERPHKCSLCPNGFISSSILKNHLRTAHQVKPYPCTKCEEKFDKQSELVTHKKALHNT